MGNESAIYLIRFAYRFTVLGVVSIRRSVSLSVSRSQRVNKLAIGRKTVSVSHSSALSLHLTGCTLTFKSRSSVTRIVTSHPPSFLRRRKPTQPEKKPAADRVREEKVISYPLRFPSQDAEEDDSGGSTIQPSSSPSSDVDGDRISGEFGGERRPSRRGRTSDTLLPVRTASVHGWRPRWGGGSSCGDLPARVIPRGTVSSFRRSRAGGRRLLKESIGANRTDRRRAREGWRWRADGASGTTDNPDRLRGREIPRRRGMAAERPLGARIHVPGVGVASTCGGNEGRSGLLSNQPVERRRILHIDAVQQ